MKILSFGSLNVDHTYFVDDFVSAGKTITSHKMQKNFGGKGLNQSIALARAGAAVFHAGLIGNDGAELKRFLMQNGVVADSVEMADAPTGHAIIQVDKNGGNCIIVYGGANRNIDRGYIDGVLEKFEKGDAVVLQNEINDIAYIAKKAHAKGMIVVFNPSPVDGIDIDLDDVDILILNEHEAMEMLNVRDIDSVKAVVHERYFDKTVVMTLGADGAVFMRGNETVFKAAQKVEAVDTTGAGDTFTGFFLKCYLDGMGAEAAMDIATKAAAISVTRLGAAVSIPYIDEIK